MYITMDVNLFLVETFDFFSIVQQYVSYWLLIFVYEYKQGRNLKGSHMQPEGRAKSAVKYPHFNL